MPLRRTEDRARLDEISEFLWGGPGREGLVVTVASLASSVTKLTEANIALATTMNDPTAGVIVRLADAHEQIASISRDMSEIKGLIRKVLYVLAIIGIAGLATLSRFAWMTLQAVVVKP